jgi:uncharacterized glyoxalase superfamily protein PhnB
MSRKVVPMIHVRDVRATVDWYRSIGFTVDQTYDDGGDGLSFAFLSFGSGEVMFSSGGRASAHHRRDVDLYVYTEDVDGIHEQLKDRVEVVNGPHDMFYGMREVIVRDVNGFWITFGERAPGEILMEAVREESADGVRAALDRGRLSPERLSAALAAASAGGPGRADIAGMLMEAGAVRPPAVPMERLQQYAGDYEHDQGLAVRIVLQDGTLVAQPVDAPITPLLPVDQTSFRSVLTPDSLITFLTDGGQTTGLTFVEGQTQMRFRRVGAG